MAEKVLQTRIQLKYDTYANWLTANPVLKKGEMAVATIGTSPTQAVDSVTAPQVILKVGDGTTAYKNLPFSSALAADVYGWAKAADVEFKDQKINFKKSDGTIVKTLDLSTFITNDELITKLGDYALAESIGDGSFTVTGGEGLSGSGNMTANQANNTSATISHAVPSGATVGAKGSSEARTYIKTVTTDKFGHVTGVTTGTETVTDTNQTVKVGNVTFGANDAVDIQAGANVTVTPNAQTKTITISSSYTDTNDNQTVKAGSTAFGINDAVNFVAGTHMDSVVGNANDKTITINGKDWTSTINNAVNEIATAAMEFKGATATLPSTTDLRKGSTYKVTANITVAASADAQGVGFTAKLGDTIVYDGSNKWYLIPSGDDIEDTWRPVTDVNNNSSLTFVAGAKLDVEVKDDGTITYSHGTVAAPTKTAGSGRTYITDVTTDSYGHITGYKTATESDQDLSGYKTKQAAVAEKGSATQTLKISQNENGEITATEVNISIPHTQVNDWEQNIGVKSISADTGLKINTTGAEITSQTPQIAIDDSVTFVFDCGSATTVI